MTPSCHQGMTAEPRSWGRVSPSGGPAAGQEGQGAAHREAAGGGQEGRLERRTAPAVPGAGVQVVGLLGVDTSEDQLPGERGVDLRALVLGAAPALTPDDEGD